METACFHFQRNLHSYHLILFLLLLFCKVIHCNSCIYVFKNDLIYS